MQNLSSKEIVDLISRLKDKTPEYPESLIAARKAAFMEQVGLVTLGGTSQGGHGGPSGATGGSGVFGGISTAQSILLQILIGISLVAAIVIPFVFRDKIVDLFIQSDNVVEDIQLHPVTEIAVPETMEVPATEVAPTEIVQTPEPVSQTLEPSVQPPIPDTYEKPGRLPAIGESPDADKGNQGLHLGQTPGPPNAPGHDKPGKPEKPGKPDKPEKPDKPGK